MNRNVVLAGVSFAAFVLILASHPLRADESDDFFNNGKIVHLSIDVVDKELQKWRGDPRKYVKGTMKVDHMVDFKDIAVKTKGAAGSNRGIDDKPGLTINMDKFVDGQRLHGLDKFHLANSVQDPSYINELICGELFRAAGVPASRITHATVTLNGKKRGFYYLKEGYDSGFLKRNFKSSKGNLYDGGFLRDLDQPLQVLSDKAGTKDQAELKALMAAARENDPKVRFQKLDQLLDMNQFISYLVMESMTWDWDGYPMNRNNYRIYYHPETKKLTFIPSGMDQMFHNPGGPLLPGFQGFVAQRLVETPEGRKRFFERMAELRKTVFVPEVLGKRLDDLQKRIQPMIAAAVDPNAARDFANHVALQKNRIAERAKSIDAQLKNVK